MKIFCCLAGVILTGTVLSAADKPAKPNVLFIAIDDLRPEFGAYGMKYIKSPNLDRLAARAITFNRAYCQQAVCSPSRSSLLTGCRPDTTKVYDLVTHFRKAIPDVVTLPQLFKQHGYITQGMGKIYHPGYDDVPSWSVPSTNPKGIVQYASKEAQEIVKQARDKAMKDGKTPKEVNQVARGPAFESADVKDETFHDGALANMAVAALRDLKEKKEPFFLAVGFIKPHLPFVAPKKYWDLYDPAKIELAKNPYRPKNAPEYAVQEGGELRSYNAIPTGHLPDDLARKLKHGYYASISYMDAQLGKVLDELDTLGLADNTIIVLWGDHGWKLGEHDAWCKHSNVELDTNAPLLVAVPWLKTAGKRSDALVEFVDVYPSLAELCGLPLPKHLEGVSFVPVLKNPDLTWKLAAFSQYPRTVKGKQLMGYTMRTDRYRFTRWVERNAPETIIDVELYDHKNDPDENTNLAFLPPVKKDELEDLDSLVIRQVVARRTEESLAGWESVFPTLGDASVILAKAGQWELFSLNGFPELPDRIEAYLLERTPWYTSLFSEDKYFRDWKILGKTTVKDGDVRAELLAALHTGIRESVAKWRQENELGTLLSVHGCFQPRHGIRVSHDGKVMDLLICFECGTIRVFMGDKKQDTDVTGSPQATFDDVLMKAKVPLGPRPAKEK